MRRRSLARPASDNQVLAFTASAIAAEWKVAMLTFALVFSAGLFSLLLGLMLFGVMSDRFGRRRLLILSTLFFGAATLATPL